MGMRRFRVRTLMIAVASLALAMGLFQWVGRMRAIRIHYRSQAAESARWEAIYARTARGWKERCDGLRSSVKPGDSAGEREIEEAETAAFYSAKELAHLSRVRAAAERLAARPWESPPPELSRPMTGRPGPLLTFAASSGVRYEFSPGDTARAVAAVAAGTAGCLVLLHRVLRRYGSRSHASASLRP